MDYIWQNSDWTDFKWNSDELIDLLARARFNQGSLLAKLSDLDIKLERQAQAEILIEETLMTAEIEGEHFNRDSVRSSVAFRLGLPDGGVGIKNRNVDGLLDLLLDAVVNHDTQISIERLNSWQASLFPTGYSGLSQIKVGSLRGQDSMRIVSGPIGHEKVHYVAPDREILENEYLKFIDWWNGSYLSIDGILRAAIAHFWFVTLHPYEDGNGRIARALSDMALAQDEKLKVRFYSLSAQLMKQRSEYYDVLETCQKGDGDITQWLLFFLQVFLNALSKSQLIIQTVLDKSSFWCRYAHLDINDKQRKVINKMLDMGRGNFEGGLKNRNYMSITKVSRATAARQIADLLQKGILISLPGGGRSTSYDLNWDK